MCGIAGAMGCDWSPDRTTDIVAAMNHAQAHRGPDGEGLWSGTDAVLGHRRLAIIDLSDHARQPMTNEDGSLVVVVNGEIYNYQVLRRELEKQGHVFKSHSDSETILHLYEGWRVFGEMIEAWAGATTGGSLRVLDAGCGDGINLVGLRQLAAGQSRRLTVMGVDYNPLRLQRARGNDPAARLQRASLTSLPFAEGAFDLVLCSHVIEHIPDLAPALAELCRVLRPGGLLIVGVPNEGCAAARIRNHWIQPSIGRDTDHVNFFTDLTLTAALIAAGFGIRRVERETFFFPHSYLNAGLNELAAGHWLMAALRRLFPSQAGGLIVAADKPVAAINQHVFQEQGR